MLKLWLENENNDALMTQLGQQEEAFSLATGRLAEQYDFLASLNRHLELNVQTPTKTVLAQLNAFQQVVDDDMDLADLEYLQQLLKSVRNFESTVEFQYAMFKDVLLSRFIKWVDTYRTIPGLVDKLKRNGLAKLIKALSSSEFAQQSTFRYYLDQAISRYRSFFDHADFVDRLLRVNPELDAKELASLFFEIGFVEFNEAARHLRLNAVLVSDFTAQLQPRTGIYDRFEFDAVMRKLWLTSRLITWLQKRTVQMIDPNDWQMTLTLPSNQLFTWHWELVLALQQKHDQVTCMTVEQKQYLDSLGQLFNPATSFISDVDYLEHTNWLYWLQKCQIRLTKKLDWPQTILLVYPHNDLIAWQFSHVTVNKIYQMRLQTALLTEFLN